MTRTTRHLTCIVCPRGCDLTVTLEGKAICSVEGNLCPRGKKYAEDECTHPVRTVTTTVRTSDGGLVAVKTETPIPKELMFDCMASLASVVHPLPVRVGDTILENLCGSRIIATQEKG